MKNIITERHPTWIRIVKKPVEKLRYKNTNTNKLANVVGGISKFYELDQKTISLKKDNTTL